MSRSWQFTQIRRTNQPWLCVYCNKRRPEVFLYPKRCGSGEKMTDEKSCWFGIATCFICVDKGRRDLLMSGFFDLRKFKIDDVGITAEALQ